MLLTEGRLHKFLCASQKVRTLQYSTKLLPEKIVLKLTMCFPVSFQEYKVRLSDKASRGQFVAAVRATDADQNSKLTYGIIGKTI